MHIKTKQIYVVVAAVHQTHFGWPNPKKKNIATTARLCISTAVKRMTATTTTAREKSEETNHV